MKIIRFLLLFILISAKALFSQEITESQRSLKFGIGPAMAMGEGDGVGIVYILGYQKSFWKNRLRVSPNLTYGGFIPFGITDLPDEFFRESMLSVNIYLDALKYKAVSLYIGTGGFIDYSRGLIGAGGMPPGRSSSEYFYNFYFGVNLNAGLRIAPKNKNYAIEFSPFNVNFGTDYFALAYWKLGIDIKLKQKKAKSE